MKPTRSTVGIRRPRKRAIVIGAGHVVKIGYIPALASLGWEVLILDLDARRAESVARLYRRASWSGRSLDEVDASRYDVVVVATPPASHAALTLQAIRAGARSLLVEKPPFLTIRDLDTVLEAARDNGARIVTCFIRRAWPAVIEARRRFRDWGVALGTLRRVTIAEGRPWDWPSVATVERGTTGLESMLANELPHPLDAVFHITRWLDVGVRPTDGTLESTPWSLCASVEVEPRAHPPVNLTLRGSRTCILANAVVFSFERGDVVVEMSGVAPTSGGIIVRTPSGCELVNGPPVPLPVAEQFATPLRASAYHESAAEVAAVDEWREPLKVVSLLEQRLGAPVATGSDAR
jgi:predicted dehydrogenase